MKTLDIEKLKAARENIRSALARFPGGVSAQGLYDKCDGMSQEEFNGVLQFMVKNGDVVQHDKIFMLTLPMPKRPGADDSDEPYTEAPAKKIRSPYTARTEEVFRAMADGPKSTKAICELIGMSGSLVGFHISELKKQGRIREVPELKKGPAKTWEQVPSAAVAAIEHPGYEVATLKALPADPAPEPIQEQSGEPEPDSGPVPPAEPVKAPAREKPPIGIMPRSVFDQKVNRDRAVTITEGIRRYIERSVTPPPEWVDELKDRLEILRELESQ